MKILDNRILKNWLEEDGIGENLYYEQKLPMKMAQATLYIKDDLVLSGLPIFTQVFDLVMGKDLEWNDFLEFEGRSMKKGEKIDLPFSLPFSALLTGERLALNLTQRCSAISTYTRKLSSQAEKVAIKILDTRKTTPGLRALEKYAVRMGGGYNHRMRQNDVWMVKDNHKNFFGGVEQAVDYFKSIGSFYAPIVVEIHSIDELKQAIKLNIKHVMLDNFSPDLIREAVLIKKEGMTFEASGGISLQNVSEYLIEGLDVISSGALTHSFTSVDLSLKYIPV